MTATDAVAQFTDESIESLGFRPATGGGTP
jgi:hypothetical protein